MFIVGLTGGIGSGKTTASNRFSTYGIDVIDADVIAKELVAPHSHVLSQIVQHFGSHILSEQGELKRQDLGKIIFYNETEKLWLEKLIHPLVLAQIKADIATTKTQYTILVSPLLLETSQYTLVNRIAVIDIKPDLQQQRVMQRDRCKIDYVQKIINTQITSTDRCNKAADIINNNNHINNLLEQVDRLHQKYLIIGSKSKYKKKKEMP